jgi:hypothetical protein
MSSHHGFRSRLFLQAVVTAVLAMGGSPSSAWTIPTLVVAAGAVFVALAMRVEPSWRWYVVGYEGFAIAFGLVALVSGHYVPGTVLAGWTLYYLLSPAGAGAFAGTPSWTPSAAAPWGPPVPVPAYAGAAPTAAPVPAFAPPTPPPAPAFAPPAPPPVAAFPPPTAALPAAGYAPPPPVPVAPVVPAEVPAQPLAARPAAMTILPGR